MSEIITLDSVAQATMLYTGKKPAHPLLHVIDLSDTYIDDQLLNTKICNNLYCISLKQKFCGKLRYGRQRYDFNSGVITAYSPGQVIQIEEKYQRGQLDGWSLMFHPDLLLKHPLAQQVRQLGYFSYDIYEALHLSEHEQQILENLALNITTELQQNQDTFSHTIVISYLELMLKYIDRHFNRQFLTRKPFDANQVETFLSLVDSHIEQTQLDETGLPSVAKIAEKMTMSPTYLSDLLRSQTGKSAQELIHQQLIEKAKYLLLNSNDSVATIAYKLGFEYPQYFSRIFKKKTTLTPAQYRNVH
ncbi:helix-turn-helix domain-containing protein [Thalassotalea montiporae]